MIRTQKEQCILCFWCCQGQQHNGRSPVQNFVSKGLVRKVSKKLIWMVKVILERQVILSVSLYAILGFVEIIVLEVILCIFN